MRFRRPRNNGARPLVVSYLASAFSPLVSPLIRSGGISRFGVALSALGFGAIVLAPPAQAAGSVNGKTIVVDPGHGGKDPGAVANGIQEKGVTLAIGRQLASILQAEGANVVMTRSSDVNPAPNGSVDDDLQARVTLAQQSHAAAFVSIHANESADPGVAGATTFYGPVCGFYSGAKLSSTDVGRSYSLAGKVQAAVVARTQERDDGTQAAAFWVLGNPGIPAILVETGFLSNAAEAGKLATPSYQHLMADAIADGLNAFFASGDATGTPPVPSDGLAGCSGTAPKDDRTQGQSQSQAPQWVQTTASTPLLSGADGNGKIFATLPPQSYLKVLGQSGGFLNVLNPVTNGPGFVDAKKVGPSGPPPAPPAFQSFWVENFRPTQLWSGYSGGISFGPLPVWSYLQVLAPSSSSRLFVRIAATGNVAYVDRADVGPSGPPPGTADSSAAPANPAPAQPAPSSSVVVAAGDTLTAIAAKVGASVADLIAANHLGPDGAITAGQTLVVPGGTSPAPAAAAPAQSGSGSSVVVAAGDTLSAIAARTGVSTADLIAANHLPADGLITIGQKLLVPSGGSQAPAPAAPATVTVGAGDTLSAIAQRVGTSVQSLVGLNHLASPDNIQPGQTLQVPAS